MENFSEESILSILNSSEARKNGCINYPPWQKGKSSRTQNQILNFYINKEKLNSDEDSDEDKKELLQAVKMHLKNKPDKKKTQSVDISKFEAQGAIPKLRKQENVNGTTKKKSKNKSQLKIIDSSIGTELLPTDKIVAKNSNSFQKIPTNSNHKRTRFKEVGKFGESRLQIMNACQPFLYIVPENPSPYFTLPAGNYYVTTDDPGLPPVASIICHPVDPSAYRAGSEYINEIKNSTPTSQNELNKIRSTWSAIPFKNNLIRCGDGKESKNSGERDGNLTLSENIEDLERVLLAEDFDRVDVPVHILKCRLKAKINALNVAMEKLSLLQTIEKIEPDLFSKTVVYNKQFGNLASDSRREEEIKEDKIFILELLFPHADRQGLREEVEECDGSEHSFLDLVKRKVRGVIREADIHPGFSLLFNQLPDYNLEVLYYKWLECLGNEEKLRTYVEEEKKILEFQQIIQTEMPEMNKLEARKRAENFFYDECAWDRFLAERRCLKKIDEQFLRMSVALPEIDPAELLIKCQELQGEEDLISEYILNVEYQKKKEAHFLTMQSILPNAQPDFLREKIEEAKGDDQSINFMTNSLLESNDYPKVEVDGGAIERQKLWQTYVDNFDVKDFLLEIETEKELVLNENEEQLVLEFFKARYPTKFDGPLQENELLRNLKMSNMLGMCEHLDDEVEFINLQYSNFKNSKFTKSFLLKVVKIDKRKEIDRYLQESEDWKKAQGVVAREHNAFLQCPLCYEDEVVESDAGTCSEGHVFCKMCIKRYVIMRTSDGIYRFQCLSENCNGFFSDRILRELLPKSVFEKITSKIGAEEACKANVEGLEFCTACDFGYIPLPEEKIFSCQNPDCLKQICRNCKEDNHIPLQCEEVERSKDLQARKKIEEAMSEKLIRFCPDCGKKFIKQDGCNKIICVCGKFLCYVCGKVIYDYSHFSNERGACPLYSKNETLHHTDVVNAGIEARNQILQQDPDIRILFDPIN